MEEEALGFLAGLLDDAVWFSWGGWAVLIIGALWLAVWAGGQFELADVQACQAQGSCVVTTSPGHFHTRSLVSVPPAKVQTTPPANSAGK
jgi:hypothetical protein